MNKQTTKLNNSYNLEVIPKSTDVLVLKCDIDDISFDVLQFVIKDIKNKFPDNEVVFLPNPATLQLCDLQTIKCFRDVLDGVIANITGGNTIEN